MTVETTLFFIVAVCAIASAVLMVMQRNPVMSAIFLIGNFFTIAMMYLILQAQLLAVLQIVVYTGAIMVLVIFVIMLLNLGDEKKLTEQFDIKRVAGVILVFGFLIEMLYLFGTSDEARVYAGVNTEAASVGTVESMGKAMFSTFLFPFEITGLLLLAAIVGAVVLAKRRF